MAAPESERTESASSVRASFRIDAIASGFVGAVALAVSTYNVYLQREQIRAQVWPHIEWTYSERYSAADGHFERSTLGECWMQRGQTPVRVRPGEAEGFTFED